VCSSIHIHGEVVVVGHGEVSQLSQVHVSAPDGVQDEDVRGKTQSATLRSGGRTATFTHHLIKNTSLPSFNS
jgi:hypothetical protein